MKYLLVGNPNVGKSSLFNIITSSFAHVGNWSGVTVEKTIGKSGDVDIIDLPGTYSVCPSSEDEGVVSYALLNEHYNGLINVVDATHLKRNLYLSVQLLELGAPLYLVVNMIDEVDRSGMIIDTEKISKHLGCTVIKTSARTKKGIDELKLRIKDVVVNKPLKLEYGDIISQAIDKIKQLLRADRIHLRRSFLAIQILEGNESILNLMDLNKKEAIQTIIEETEQEIIKNKIALSLKGAIFNVRRKFIEEVISDCLIKEKEFNRVKHFNNKIDTYITHPVLGLIIFLGVLLFIYFLTFDMLGFVLSDLMDTFIQDSLTPFLANILPHIGIQGALLSLILDGILGGVAGVLVFVPQVAILFFLLAILEGTGYMARVAIMLDTLLSKFGLNGKSIVPLVTGFGCNVPAILATRTIVDKKERILTILILPFMSCSARIPIYALIAGNLFSNSYLVRIYETVNVFGATFTINFKMTYMSLVMISLYVIGVLVALVSAKLFSLSIFKDASNTFILEVPPYRIPRLRNAYQQMKNMSIHFIEKAGKLILVGTIVIWFLSYIGHNGTNFVTDVSRDQSLLAMISGFFAPLFSPLGFGTWQATSGLIVGFLAKEFVASSMIVVYDGALNVSSAFTLISAYSFMVFSLLYVPCLAAVGAIKQETGSWKWTLFSIGFSFTIAYLISLLIYQIGSFFIALG
ncbi:ferrous iron transport protein B [Haloplasma contractile]|uniref:Ferrous iron transport protein B n=1 Tax=Haloplasma contractile SSD-17B TaxID=1033810 RepID=U2FKZ7_9MOLU|nr:ferrous iron transport protein B [Haloplasma contractile]ERJ13450.1 Ferrous iron transport protein B [Haloplasma contractile SSD-17B]